MNYMNFYSEKLNQHQLEQFQGFSFWSPIESTKKMIGDYTTIVVDKVVYILKWVIGGAILFYGGKFALKKYQEHKAKENVAQQFEALAIQVGE